MATEPDPPIWTAPSKIAEGSLSEMVEQWGALPQSHQGHHIIKIHNGELREANIRKMLEDPRHQG